MGNWIAHDGQGMPVSGDTLVYTRHSNGFDDLNPTRADFWHDENKHCSHWHDTGDGLYIEAYKVVENV